MLCCCGSDLLALRSVLVTHAMATGHAYLGEQVDHDMIVGPL